MAKDLIDQLQERYGADFHPAYLLAECAQSASSTLKEKMDCCKILLPYVSARLESVKLSGEVDLNANVMSIVYTTDEPAKVEYTEDVTPSLPAPEDSDLENE